MSDNPQPRRFTARSIAKVFSQRTKLSTASGSIANRTARAEGWWSQTGSNRRPPACKAGALPAELWPLKPVALDRMVGLGRLELPTSRLSSARSNQLSYKPLTTETCRKQSIEAIAGQPLARVRPRRKRNEDGGVPPMQLNDLAICWPLMFPRDPIERHKPKLERSERIILRKEVIQPQVPLRLPCYDFTPVADPTVAGCLLAVSAPSSGKANSHGVTGGVYKARERIHRSVLICDY